MDTGRREIKADTSRAGEELGFVAVHLINISMTGEAVDKPGSHLVLEVEAAEGVFRIGLCRSCSSRLRRLLDAVATKVPDFFQ